MFLFPGGGGDIRELDPLIDALETRRPLIGVAYWESEQDEPAPATVAAMSDIAVRSIIERQPTGPYTLAGYSLGGLVALEVARRLIEKGHAVRPPILIDALTHQSAWPWPVFLLAGIRYQFYRTCRRREQGGSVAPDGQFNAQIEEIGRRCRAARAVYRPAPYPGSVRLIHAVNEPYVGGLGLAIWRGLVSNLELFPVAARHLDLLRGRQAVATLARMMDELLAIDARRDTSRLALVVTGVSWDRTARLARELDRVGFQVAAAAPSGHPIAHLDCLKAFHVLQPLRAQQSLETAIIKSRPDILIPADDFVTDLLHRLHVATRDGGVRAAIERSVGNPKYYSRVFDRDWVTEIARGEGVAVPLSVGVKNREDLQAQLDKVGVPAFLKIDGSWGGLGVARIEKAADAEKAWRQVSGKLGAVRAIKRALFNGDISGIDRVLRHREPTYSVQEAKEGQLAIVSALCSNGRLLGMLSARVLAHREAFGAATMIHVDDQLPLRDAVGKIVRRLGLSGLCGFDFILSPDGREAFFIEMNPRATQTSDFIGESDGDLLEAMLRSQGGQGVAREGLLVNGTVLTIATVSGQAQPR